VKTFELTDKQMEKVEEWQKQHTCSSTGCSKQAIGASSLSFVFRETNLITEVEARCDCGDSINLTEHEKA